MSSPASSKRVLIVEDHDDSRELLAALLRRSGFHVTSHNSCKSAEPHLEACDADIALLDVRMPDRCGDDFGKELRERCPKTMIVFVTGEALIDPLKEAVPDCFVIRKPINVAVLMELLECFCSDSRYASPMRKEMEDRARPSNL
jgi:DNA-binding NtrC family response regulator